MSTVSTPPPATHRPPASADNLPSSLGNRKKRGRGWSLFSVIVLLVAIAAGSYFLIGRDRLRGGVRPDVQTAEVQRRTFTVKLNEKGELEATNSVDVKCEVEGRSTIIWLIPEGTEVKKGDLLVKIASNEIDDKVRAEQIKVQNAKAAADAAKQELDIALDQHASDIRKAELALDIAKTELEKYLKGDYELQLLEKKLAVETAKKTWEQSKGRLADSEALFKKKFITERELESNQLDEYKAGVEVKKSERAMAVFLDFDHPKNIQQKESDVAEAAKELERTRKKSTAQEAKLRSNLAAKDAEYQLTRDRLEKLLEQQKKTEIRAPADGLVVYYTGRHRWDRVQINEGAEVWERQTIITLPDTTQMQAKLRIHEAKTSKIALGQSATVEVEGIPGRTFTGEVTRIAPLADSQNNWLNPNLKEYDTEVTIDPNDVELKPGVTARVEITVRRVEDVLSVPVQSIFSRKGKTFAFVGATEQRARAVEIEVGHTSDEWAEVRDGLSEGDRVMLVHSDALIAKLPPEVKPGANGAEDDPDATDETQTRGGRKMAGGRGRGAK
jgi:HlyD family secretion protein